MPPDETTTMQLLIAQMERVSDQIGGLPSVCAKLESVVGTTVDLEHRLREVATELRTRDDAQSKMIDDLREKLRDWSAETKALSNKIDELQKTVLELKADLGQRVMRNEQQLQAMFNTSMRTNERLTNLEEAAKNPESERFVENIEQFRKEFNVMKTDLALLPEMRLQLKDVMDLFPWMKAAKWAIIAAAVVVVGWLAKVFITMVLTSGVTP